MLVVTLCQAASVDQSTRGCLKADAALSTPLPSRGHSPCASHLARFCFLLTLTVCVLRRAGGHPIRRRSVHGACGRGRVHCHGGLHIGELGREQRWRGRLPRRQARLRRERDLDVAGMDGTARTSRLGSYILNLALFCFVCFFTLRLIIVNNSTLEVQLHGRRVFWFGSVGDPLSICFGRPRLVSGAMPIRLAEIMG